MQTLREYVGKMPVIMAGAGVLIINASGEMLLQHRTDSERWGLPGGAMELGESFEQAACREVEEETGLRVEALEFLMTDSGSPTYHVYPNGDPVYLASAYFVARRYSGAIRPDVEETLELQWFSQGRLPDFLGDNDARVIQTYINRETTGQLGIFWEEPANLGLQNTMAVDIRLLGPGEEPPWALLRQADPSDEFIRRYLQAGQVWIAQDARAVLGVYVLQEVDAGIVEVVNMAVDKPHRRMGVGRKLLRHAMEQARMQGYQQAVVATGNSSLGPLALYQQAGFRIVQVDVGFYAREYAEPLFEDGIPCVDKLILTRCLGPRRKSCGE